MAKRWDDTGPGMAGVGQGVDGEEAGQVLLVGVAGGTGGGCDWEHACCVHDLLCYNKHVTRDTSPVVWGTAYLESIESWGPWNALA